MEMKRRVLFLGDEIALELFPDGDAVGNELFVDGLPFTVVGVMEPKLQTAMNNGPDADRAIIPAATFELIYGNRYLNHMMLRPRSVLETPKMKKALYETLGRRYKFSPDDERALGVWDMVEAEQEGAKVFLGIQIFLGLIGGLTLLLAGVGVANIMYVTVKERTPEFGVKRALGAHKWRIKAQVIFEALIISLTGGALGLGISAAVVYGISSIPEKEGAMEFLANPSISWPVALVTTVILALIGLLAGYFPARKAARVDPVEALRYE
jgi:putative ABC transport system permease protein